MYIKSKNGTSERSVVEVELDHTLMGRIGRDGVCGKYTAAQDVDGWLGIFECEWVFEGDSLCGGSCCVDDGLWL